MQSVAQQLERLLREFEELVPDIEAIVVVNDEGLTLASVVPLGVEEERIAAMATIGFSLSERSIAELERGEWEHAIIKGTDGVLVIHSLEGGGAVAVIASKDAKTGMILYMMKRLVKQISEVLKGGLSLSASSEQSGGSERSPSSNNLDFGIPPIG